MAKGLDQLLNWEGNVEETFCRSFVIQLDSGVEIDLVPNGSEVPVTNENREG